MARIPRNYGKSKTYHIMLKGIDDQNIFYDNKDREKFLEYLSITKQQYGYDLYAYCLMDNHVHMVMKSENEFLSKSIHSLMVRYAHYFNKKYKRKGHLVQNRFKSKNIENQRYFLEVCRYIHQNPQNAGFAKTEHYEWSSFKEYIGKGKIVDKQVLLHYFNNDIKEFVRYMTEEHQSKTLEEFAEYEIMGKISDSQIQDIIMQLFGIKEVSEISTFFKIRTKTELEKDIQKIKRIKGTNKSQVARIIRVSRWIIDKIW